MKKSKAKLKVFIIVEFKKGQDARVHSVYVNRLKAEERVVNLLCQHRKNIRDDKEYTCAILTKKLIED